MSSLTNEKTGEEGFFELAKDLHNLESGKYTGEDGFLELAKNLKQEDESSWLDTVGDYGKTIIKGTVEGLSALGRMMGPLTHEYKPYGETYIPIATDTEKELEKVTDQLEELLPYKGEEGFIQKGVRRGLGMAPSAIAFPGSQLNLIPRSILAGFLGEGAKELGAPPLVQAAAEITAFIGPDVTKKLLSTGKHKEIIDVGRRFGMTDEQIAPLLQSEFKQRWLSKLSPKRGKTKKILTETKKGLGSGYDYIRSRPESSTIIPEKARQTLIKDLGDIGMDIPSSVRKKIATDMNDLLKEPITIDSLVNLFQDINHELGPNTKQLTRFKDPIMNAIESVSPKISKEFSTLNEMYSRYSNIAERLKPNIASDIVKAAEAFGMMKFIVGADPVGTSAILLEKGARIGARELLLKPRLQQLSEKFLLAVNQGKYNLASKITHQISDFIKEEDEKAYIEPISEENLRKIFNQKE